MIVAHNEVGPYLISKNINDSLLRLRLSIYLLFFFFEAKSTAQAGLGLTV